MSKRIAIIALMLWTIGLNNTHADDNVCPCIPIGKVWIATSCETWNCAQAAMVLANGDPYVMAVPTNDKKYGWVIVRQVVAGSAATSTSDPFDVTSYTTIDGALNSYRGVDPNTLPLMLTTIDGTTLVLHLHDPAPSSRRRATAH
jgi:hypothetical protein